MQVFPFLFCLRFLGGEVGGAVLDVVGAWSLSWRGRRQGHLEEDKEEAIMGVQKEDVEKFLNGNPDFAKKYFAKKMNTSTISKVSGLPEKQIDFSQFQELSQVSYSFIFCLLLILFLIFSDFSVLFKIEESKIMYDLIKDMQENINMEKVVFKILRRVSALLHADRCSLFMYRQRNGVGELATRLFNVSKDSEFDDCIVPPDSEIVYPLDMGIVGNVALTKKSVNVKNVKEVRRREG